MDEDLKDKQNEKPVESADDFAETVATGLTEAEHQRIRIEALEKAKTIKHSWVAKGRGVLLCTSCDFPHRSFIDPSKILIGIEADGTPILQST